MHDFSCESYVAARRSVLRGLAITILLPATLLLSTVAAHAHGVDYRVERGETVLVHFSSQHQGPMAGAGFRVFTPDGRRVFASGSTDMLGRAVFAPDRPGDWRLLMATEDGHGAEVEISVGSEEIGLARPDPGNATAIASAGRLSATAAGAGYLLGLGGLLALWRLRR